MAPIRPRSSRRLAGLLTAGAVTVALLAGACGSARSNTATTPEQGAPTDAAAGIDAGTPVDGGKLVWGLETDTDSFSPMSGRWDRSGHMMGSALFDPLATLDASGHAVPYLAESITPADDTDTRWDIKLRPGVTFSDGEPLDSAVVVRNLTEQKKALITGQSLAGVADVVAVDPLTTRVTTTAPWATFPVILASQVGYMASIRMIDDPHGGEHPIGTGPFVLQEWVKGDHMTTIKNRSYWQAGLPHLDELDFKVDLDTQQQVTDLSDGTFDAFTTSTPSSVAALRQTAGINVLENTKGEERFATLNTTTAPFDHLSARQALAYATDIDRFVADNGSGAYEKVSGMFAPGQMGYTTDTGYPSFDLPKAEQLVQQYTAETGQPLAFTFVNTDSVDDLKVSQSLKDMWEAAGMQVTLENIKDEDEVVAVVLGDYQAADWRNFGQPDPDGDYIWWHSSSIGKDGSLSLNTARYSTPAIDAALDAARATTDPAARDAQYQIVEQQINAGIPYVWYARVTSAIAADKRVHGYGEANNGTDSTIGPKTWVAKLWIEPSTS
ncbi:MAG: ABC transporter substrate-binding protein [Acidimicrobiales bacterium]